MRLSNAVHTSRSWRVHELTSDFTLEDVWALPTPGGRNDFTRLVQDFPRLMQGLASGDSSHVTSRATRMLFAIRRALGRVFRWDGSGSGVGYRVPTLRDRLPADLRDAPSGPDLGSFASVYLLDDEWAVELANRTVHGVMHIGWVPDDAGGYRGEMAVYAKPNGLLGTWYMHAIAPFRRMIVYPAMMRQIERRWRAGISGAVRPAPEDT
ncbi:MULTISPECIES: DUF2867 domain-containing protein [unclassified Rhodococcus (in: high G+C Gram-positive bacteria)]|uniref:DUF2867 domain-containing protein n=1 Tax=unclassified Rhodococcus (in: high G+C Gram-positive bacteria) TaxID=192944 RepID=UPI00163ABC7A|nr:MULTISPECIES: DUF2867 domain-containing protein [unclassified Rhodococcus (in: high G+C Gram-positive bacteria)]MBC2640598.1 DUF2867 domain-containing protein [Rhodococcus sp. 3A]MBC2894656.1 DUF2867 domain-containing protein [Rhodococcus sp. 4CII]